MGAGFQYLDDSQNPYFTPSQRYARAGIASFGTGIFSTLGGLLGASLECGPYAWVSTPSGYGLRAERSRRLALLAMDDQPATKLTGFAPGEWNWANNDNQGGVTTIEVTEPGLHTLHLWQREDGLRVDRILLTTDAGYNPINHGPPESEIK